MKQVEIVMNRLILSTFLFLMFSLTAHGDVAVELKPGPNDISEKAAKEIAAEFFAVQCGITKEKILAAEWECYFRDISSFGEKSDEPHWSLVIRHLDRDTDPWGHCIALSGQGELLYWEAHDNMGYTVAEPDFPNGAIYAQPLATDTQEEEILQAVRESLIEKKAYSPEEAAAVTFQTYFIFHERLNQGAVPAWLVYVMREGRIEWKALYGYNGYAISMVPAQQDFLSYFLPGEQFWDFAFGEGNGYDELVFLAGIMDGTMPLEERVFHTDRWRPYLERWMEDHPYYMNKPGVEYDIILDERFGQPDENALTQEEAISIAVEEAVSLGCNREVLTAGKISVYYYVTDPSSPVWRVFFYRIRSATTTPLEQEKAIMHYNYCDIRMNAYTGEIIHSNLLP